MQELSGPVVSNTFAMKFDLILITLDFFEFLFWKKCRVGSYEPLLSRMG
jgi:hypothetical protein